ncbi:hypothetical protein CQA49_01375 [Helicobacter sp. MIT 00-7814]|uniref:hypothetical protein n=1 Tax=unclassified Helicobacter TaxID=2593540 RepID=UPI000E1E35B9|nr:MULTISPECIES: hypothetical protein [unclassified Helicobacter]RDU53277.1 hypothetical protein CQA37_07110 [Helicobacter sp. MIT 99-10781]RDU56970.1 hypothetical protein CQA49_01375 [Helicobacter sp. MIT 00-7814]
MAKNETLSTKMARNGMKLRTWARSQGLSQKDIGLLNQISHGKISGKYGRSKELKELLIKSGFMQQGA